jgi:3D (Asp-Asp-Asp) domain-containing protein
MTEDQRMAIVERDAAACAALKKLWADVRQKKLTVERAARLRSNIIGNSLQRHTMKKAASFIAGLLFCLAAEAKTIVAETTAYCHCSKCTRGTGITALGRKPIEGITVAGPRRLPLNTLVHIEGVGRRRVEDRLHPRYDHRFDIYFKRHSDALAFGKKKLRVTVIK